MPQLTDALTRHQIYLQRYAGSQVNAIAKELRRLALQIRARIASEDLTENQAARLRILRRDIERLIGTTLTGSAEKLNAELKRLAEYEAEHTLKVYAPAVSVKMVGLSEVGISQILTEMPMKLVQGGKIVATTLQDAYRTFAGAVASDVAQVIQAGIIEAKTTQQIAREARALVDTRSRRQAEALVRTATNHVASSARAAVYEANSDIISHEEFVATLDDRTTVTCFSGGTKVSPIGSINKLFRRWYEGEMIIIATSLGDEIECTPNHPILTSVGWLAAHKIQPGQHIVYSVGNDGLGILGCDYICVPTSIADLFDSVSKIPGIDAVRVCAAPEDFHGDIMRVDNKIDILTPDADLCAVVNAIRREDGRKFHFTVCEDGVFFLGNGFSDQLFVRRPPSIEPPQFAPVFFQDSKNPAIRSLPSQRFENDARPHAGCEEGNGIGLIFNDEFIANASFEAWHCIESLEQGCDSRDGSVISPAKFSGRNTGAVVSQYVISVRREFKSCHVYNLQTSREKYIAGGIIVHNCASLDGNIYQIGEGPIPPVHYGCRSVRVAVVNPQYQIPGMGNTRASMDGPVSGNVTYASWLKGQDEAFQNDVLGPERAALFRSGEVPLSRFTDDNGIVFTLDELRAREGL